MSDVFKSMMLLSMALLLEDSAHELHRLAKHHEMTKNGEHYLKVCKEYLTKLVDGITLMQSLISENESQQDLSYAQFFELVEIGAMCTRWRDGFLEEFCPQKDSKHATHLMKRKLQWAIEVVQNPDSKGGDDLLYVAEILTGFGRQLSYQDATGGMSLSWQPASD